MLKVFRRYKYNATFYCVSKCYFVTLRLWTKGSVLWLFVEDIMSDSCNRRTVVAEMHIILFSQSVSLDLRWLLNCLNSSVMLHHIFLWRILLKYIFNII